MKILFTNEIKDATLTALDQNENYPASNLSSVFAKLKYKGAGYSDTITATFDDNVSANSFFYTFTNASSMELRLYSNASALLDTITVDCTYDSGAEYFADYTNVRRIEIDIASPVAEDVYLGGIALGMADTFPFPLAKFDNDLIDNSSKTSSADGQTSYLHIKPLTSYSLQFTNVKRTEYHTLIEKFEKVGGGHIWADITEDNHAVYRPMYCTTGLMESPTREKSQVNFKMTLTEAR